MRVLFWGTPEFAVPSLRALLGAGHEVVGVVTQPDRQAGRGRKLKASAVKEVAVAEGLPILVPDRPRGQAFVEEARALRPELSVVAAYGHILPLEVLEVPEQGSLNLHASLLPELRGAAPVNWALIRGLDQTGVTIMRMTEGMDEGPILLQRELPISANDTASGVLVRLAELGAEALAGALALLEAGTIEARPQDHGQATYAPKISRETARIDWSRSAVEVGNHMRGMDAVPGAWTTLDGESIKLFRPVVLKEDAGAAPGSVLQADPDQGLVVATGRGRLRLDEVQPAGKRRMGAAAWLRGRGPLDGARFS
ncbi:MAG: methionyl-tRNA formyltransferase [Gemmatimonadetes bacterium]|nr:methionyl-tRNA formyltransferase [Gemmatimonadota bacterium]